ncbi:MAG TPA: TadE family protein [Oculatellaceae cyanobacterium]
MCSRKVNINNARNRRRGVSAVEIAIVSFLVIVIVGIAVDATIFTMAYARLDSTTRDAARAAAAQPKASTDVGNTCAAALKAAKTQLQTHSTDGVFIKQPVLTGTTAPYFVYNDFGGSPPAPQSAYVTVTCSEDVYLPIPVTFFGASFGPFLTSGNHITLSRQYVFPIVKTKFY